VAFLYHSRQTSDSALIGPRPFQFIQFYRVSTAKVRIQTQSQVKTAFGYDTTEPSRWVLTFRSSILHPSSEHDVYLLLIWTEYVPPSRWYQTALCYKPEDHNIILHRYEYLDTLYATRIVTVSDLCIHQNPKEGRTVTYLSCSHHGTELRKLHSRIPSKYWIM
jgi:hypothetical protein